MDASDEIVSTIRSAGCRAASRARRTAAIPLVTPVEVSLWTTQTALIAWALVFRQARPDLRRVHAAPPVARQEQRIEPEPGRDPLPERREVPRLGHQDAVTRRQRVGQRRLPRAGSRRREQHDRLAGLDDGSHAGKHLAGQLAERRPTVIDGRGGDRAQDAIGHVGRSGDLQEMSAAGMWHGANLAYLAARFAGLGAATAVGAGFHAAVCVLAAADFLTGHAVPPPDRCLAEREVWIRAALPLGRDLYCAV